ncbi:MAG: hypothetical protein KBD64_04715 [Gammaproteobacteria bacterium]|nr:hypothetical protein [Gammaproteobacteria bacterium]
MPKSNIPHKIVLSADDPFIKYLGYMYNSGVDFLLQAEQLDTDLHVYKENLDGYMRYTKLDFLLGKDKKSLV